MNDPRYPQGHNPYRQGRSDQAEPLGGSWGAQPDPAYAGQYSYPSYTPPPEATQELPAYWTQTQYQQPPDDGAPPPPEPPQSPRWLWLLAGLAVLLVVGLVVALVITNSSSNRDTVVAPMPEPTVGTTPRTTVPPVVPPTTTRPPRTTTERPPTRTTPPTTVAPVPPTTATPGQTQSVVYTISGEGRAMNVTYVDTGGMMQMEFNVVLPWSKEVALESAADIASVSVVTLREVTCTISVDGSQLRSNTGIGLTLCSPLG